MCAQVKKMFIISKTVHDFTKLRVIVYLGNAAKCCLAIGNYNFFFTSIATHGPFC